MGECLDQLHVQCVILGEILLGTLDRVREELINDGELRLYQGAAMETGRRQVVEYLITMYYRYKAQKLLVQKAPSDSVEIKVEANDGWQTHQGEEQEKVIEGTSILKLTPTMKPVRKRGRPSATVSKATISISNINNSYEVDNRDEPQTKTKRISEEFAVTSETVDTKWLNCYVNLEPSVASDNNKVNNEPKSESDDHITDAGDNMDDISSDEEGHPDDHIKDADYIPSGNTPVKFEERSTNKEENCTVATESAEKKDDPNKHSCSKCIFSSKFRSSLVRHQQTIHEGKRKMRYNCRKCMKSFTTPEECTFHQDMDCQSQAVVCESCGKECISQRAYSKHKRLHDPTKGYSCNICDKRFHSKVVLQGHMNSHTKTATFPCVGCKKLFRQQTTLSRHIQNCIKKKMKVCPHCGKEFRSRDTLRDHVKAIHELEYRYRCEKCGAVFLHRESKNRHKQKCKL